MKFQVAKNDTTKCTGCKTYIMRNQEMTIQFIAKTQSIICFHTECYLKWYSNMFLKKWADWKMGKQERVKIGRPVLDKNADKATRINRLRTLLNYHRRTGHGDKVDQLQNVLSKIASE